MGPATLACSGRQFVPYLLFLILLRGLKANPAKFESVSGMNRSQFGLEVPRPAPWLTPNETAHWPVGMAWRLLCCSSPIAGFSAGVLRRNENNFACVSSLGFGYSYQQWFSSVKVTTLSKHRGHSPPFTFQVFIDTEI